MLATVEQQLLAVLESTILNMMIPYCIYSVYEIVLLFSSITSFVKIFEKHSHLALVLLNIYCIHSVHESSTFVFHARQFLPFRMLPRSWAFLYILGAFSANIFC